MNINVLAAWGVILLGFIAGAVMGLFFHRSDWLGGYASWQRRMLRLGHIACFGMGFINLAFAWTVEKWQLAGDMGLASGLFLVGAMGMPLICFASAFWEKTRHLFFIPVASLLTGTVILMYGVVWQH